MYTNQKIERVKKNSTTLDVTIVPNPDSDVGVLGEFFKLQYGPGDKTLVREELACSKKLKNPKPLASFIQITDVHIIDAASPARAAFLAQYIPEVKELADSFRPQEALSLQVEEAMVRKINSIKIGPKTKAPITFVVSCGDNSDSQQKNELQNYINILDGGVVFPNPATPGKYVGVQDNFPTVNFKAYYHPDVHVDPEFIDLYKTDYAFPDFPGILNQAAKPFKATGLIYPWYTANGNHDCTKLGNYGLNLFTMLRLFDQFSTGTLPDNVGSKMIEAMTPDEAKLFVAALERQNTEAAFDIIKNSILREVPMSNKRLQFTAADFISMHFNTKECPGPVGHGFNNHNRTTSTMYYSFRVSDSVAGLVLDTCNPSGNLDDPEKAPNGSIGRVQLSWLESELIKRHSSYLNNQGELVFTDNEDELCVLFSHHDHNTMNNIFNSADVVDLDPQKIDGVGFINTIHRFPNVILWVNGHTHRNIVTPLKKDQPQFNSKKYKYTGFWEVNTASHIDYPENSRIIEISNNRDRTLSIFGTIIDHLSPPSVDAKGPEYSITEMASISRSLSFNDPFNDPRTRGGTRKDKNVELIINNPLIR